MLNQNQRSVFSDMEPVPKTQFFNPEKLDRCGGSCDLHGNNFALALKVSAAQKLKAYIFLVEAFDLAVEQGKLETAKGFWNELAKYDTETVKSLENLVL
ncbi:MAG: hypothetical protein ABSG57_08095 [Candidatus Bathyarchaeia archaeon]